MPAPTTVDAFLECVRKSHLIDSGEMDKYVDSLRDRGGIPGTPKTLGARFVQDGLLTGFQANELLLGHHKGFYVGNYRVLEPLGAGGMSRVFLCEHAAMGHRVAMKVVPVPAAGEDSSLIERFLREARANGVVNHPNVVRAHDFNRDGRHFYLIMDYVEGVSLHDLVRRRGPVGPLRAAHYIAQAATGLEHIQENGLVHRDLKPANLLLDRKGIIKILDLGLARFLGDQTDGLTEKYDARLILGTADYLSPEQAMRSHEVDIRADIYSLGATFYYLLSGRAPFEGKTVPQKLLAHQINNPEPIQQHCPEVPEEMAAIVHRMLEKRPEDRHQRPGDLVEALQAWTVTPIPPPLDADFPTLASSRSSAVLSRSRSSRTPPPPNLAISTTAQRSRKVPRVATTPARELSAIPSPDAIEAAPRSEPTLPKSTPSRGLGRLVLVLVMLGLLLGGTAFAVWHFFLRETASNPRVVQQQPPASSPEKGEKDDSKGEGKTSPEKPARPAVNAPTGSLVVSRSGAENTFRTIRDALAAAPLMGGRIVLADRDHEEQLVLRGPMDREVTIEAFPNLGPVTWKMPSGVSGSPALIDLTQVASFRLKGVILDGGGAAEQVIHLTGACPGLILEDVQVQNFARAGIVLSGCSGESDRPVSLVRVRLAPGRDAEAGIVCENGPGGSINRHLSLRGLRFEGPLQVGLLITGGLMEAEVRQGRFAQLQAGVRYRPGETRPPLTLTLANNTMHGVQKGLHFETAPPVEGTRVEVTNNLFLRTPRLASLDGLTWGVPRPVEWVWTEEGLKKEDQTKIPEGTRYFRATFEAPAKPTRAILELGCAQSAKAWLNGKPVGNTPSGYFTKRVYSFDVTALIHPGRNVLAVEALNTLDPFNKFVRSAAGLVAHVIDESDGKTAILTATGSSWKSMKMAPDGWQLMEFDDASWVPARPWPTAGNWPWSDAVWDTTVRAQLKGQPGITLIAAGNVRDYDSSEGYPTLESKRGYVKDLPVDPTDEPAFLRYKKDHPLNQAAPDRGPVGAPPE